MILFSYICFNVGLYSIISLFFTDLSYFIEFNLIILQLGHPNEHLFTFLINCVDETQLFVLHVKHLYFISKSDFFLMVFPLISMCQIFSFVDEYLDAPKVSFVFKFSSDNFVVLFIIKF